MRRFALRESTTCPWRISPCMMPHAIACLVYLMYYGYITTMYTGESFIKTYTAELSRLTSMMYHQTVNAFNRGFVGLRIQFLDNMVHRLSQKEITSESSGYVYKWVTS